MVVNELYWQHLQEFFSSSQKYSKQYTVYHLEYFCDDGESSCKWCQYYSVCGSWWPK